MRYKKKHILKESLLLEALLIDTINTLSSTEKKVLKSLYKKYYKPKDPEFRWWRLNTYELQDELHIKWDLPFDMSFKLAHIFVNHGDVLFTDNKIKTEYKPSEILNVYISRFVDYYRSDLVNDILNGGNWILNFDGEKIPQEVSFWSSYNGFILYLRPSFHYISELPHPERVKYGRQYLMIKCMFDFSNENDEPNLRLVYKINEELDYNRVIIDKAVIDLPEKVTKKDMSEWLDNLIMEQIKPIVENFKFPEPPQNTEDED